MRFDCVEQIPQILIDIETVLHEYNDVASAVEALTVEDIDLLRQGSVSYTRSKLMYIGGDPYGIQDVLLQWARLVRCEFAEYIYQPHHFDDVIVTCQVTDKGAEYLKLTDHELDTWDKDFPIIY